MDWPIWTEYDGRNVVYYCQSDVIRNRISTESFAYCDMLKASLSKRFRMAVNVSQMFADVLLYSRLNNKFFSVSVNGNIYNSMKEFTEAYPAEMHI